MPNEVNSSTALVTRIKNGQDNARSLAILNAAELWADATTNTESHRRADILRDKRRVVISFFQYVKKHPAEITPLDVKEWQALLEKQGLAKTTVYYQLCYLSSFYSWAQRDPLVGQFLISNPVRLAHPKAPKPYQTNSVKSLSDDECTSLLSVIKKKAASGDIVGKRDYALLLLYVTTGMRRAEIINLRGGEVELKDGAIILHSRVKGGDYIGRELSDPTVRDALLDYLSSCQRMHVLSTNAALWTRHDRAGKAGSPLTSHAFALNLKKYAKQAGIDHIHLHQTRHTFARMVAEETGSITDTQDALGHRNLGTTRIYVNRIAVKRDKHSQGISARLKLREEA